MELTKNMQDIKIKNLVKYYGDKKVYDGFSLDIRGGEIFSLLGESGSGKTTLLRVLARLTDFSGEVEGIKSAPSFVFQKDLLIPNLTVKENLVFVCPDDRKEEAEKEAERLLEVAKISHLKDRYPKRLSGGECRRVSILRGFIFPSSVMLLDEPFNSLDVKLKYQLIDEVKRLHKEKNNTPIDAECGVSLPSSSTFTSLLSSSKTRTVSGLMLKCPPPCDSYCIFLMTIVRR